MPNTVRMASFLKFLFVLNQEALKQTVFHSKRAQNDLSTVKGRSCRLGD